MMAAILVLGTAYEGGLGLRHRAQQRNAAAALRSAQAGLECAAWLSGSSDTWRGDLGTGTWITDRSIGETRVTVSADDPADGQIELVGATLSSDADTVRFSSTGSYRTIQRTLAADYLPFPHDVMAHVVYSQSTIGLQGVNLVGDLRANGAVGDYGSVTVDGDITTTNNGSISASLFDTDTDTTFVADSLYLPAIDFDWLRAAAEPLTVPYGGRFTNNILTPDYNPWGNPSPAGIYSIDGDGDKIYLHNLYIEACLVVYDVDRLRIRSPWGNTTRYYHTTPDSTRLPALLVDGYTEMLIEAGSWGIWHPTRGFITVSSGLDGVFVCTGELWGPQSGASNPITVTGAILAGEAHILGPGTTLIHDPNLMDTPLVELVKATGLRLIAHSVVEQ